MPALSWEPDRDARYVAPDRGSGAISLGSRFVLPPLLRRPARLFSRLVDGDIALPRFAATAASALIIGGFSLYGAVLGGHMPAVVAAVTARSGFAVEQVKITGHKETSEIDILERLGLDGWTSLVGLDAARARDAIAALPWVQHVEVRKVYPRTVEIALVERQPFAIWQHGSDLSVIEKSGAVIAPYRGTRHASLPLVLGRGGPQRAAEFIDKVEAHLELAGRVKGYIRVGDRRWDLRLDNGVTIRLPEGGEDDALADIARLDREQSLLARDVASVDMRLEDRIVVKLTPDAALRRDAALEQAEKDRKKAAREKRA